MTYFDATVSTGTPVAPLGREESLFQAGRFLAERVAHPHAKYASGHLRFIHALIAYAAELRQGEAAPEWQKNHDRLHADGITHHHGGSSD